MVIQETVVELKPHRPFISIPYLDSTSRLDFKNATSVLDFRIRNTSQNKIYLDIKARKRVLCGQALRVINTTMTITLESSGCFDDFC